MRPVEVSRGLAGAAVAGADEIAAEFGEAVNPNVASAMKVPRANWPTPPPTIAVLEVSVTAVPAVAVVKLDTPAELLLHHRNS